MTGYKRRHEKDENPGKIACQSNSHQKANPAEIKRISGNRENPGCDQLACGTSRISRLTVSCEFAVRKVDQDHINENKDNATRDDCRGEKYLRERERYDELHTKAAKNGIPKTTAKVCHQRLCTLSLGMAVDYCFRNSCTIRMNISF